jgi:hypothetical protein
MLKPMLLRFGNWLTAIPKLQLWVGVALSLCAIAAHFILTQKGLYAFDFWALFSASTMFHDAPSLIYEPGVSAHFFQQQIKGFMPGIKPEQSHVFIYPPLVFILISPLQFLSYTQAYIGFSMVNLLAALCCAKMVASLARKLNLTEYAPVLSSAIWFNLATLFIMINGQLSLIFCTILLVLLLGHHKKEWKKAGIFIAILMHCKPFLFAPLCLWLFIRMPGTERIVCALVFASIGLLCTAILGQAIWISYLHQAMLVGQQAQGFFANITDMVNLRGLLVSLLGDAQVAVVTNCCSIMYLVVLVGVAVAAFKKPSTPEHNVWIPITFALGAFFSPWTHFHDLVMLLPVSLYLLASLAKHHQARRYIPVYVLSTLWSAFIPFAWLGRMALMVMLYAGMRVRRLR